MLAAALAGFYRRSAAEAAALLMPMVQTASKVSKKPAKEGKTEHRLLNRGVAPNLKGRRLDRNWARWTVLPEECKGTALPYPIPAHDIEPGMPAAAPAALGGTSSAAK